MKFTSSPIVLAIVLACMTIGAAAALSESQKNLLKKYDDMAIYNIWRFMMYHAFYKYLPSFICGNETYANGLATAAESSGLFTAADVASTLDIKAVCMDGFEMMYKAVWYRLDNKKFTYGDNDMFNYVV